MQSGSPGQADSVPIKDYWQGCAPPATESPSIVPAYLLPARCTYENRFPDRSEERRVGKESRSRWSPYHLKKKKIGHGLLTLPPVDTGLRRLGWRHGRGR